jgi:hypothetical protein
MGSPSWQCLQKFLTRSEPRAAGGHLPQQQVIGSGEAQLSTVPNPSLFDGYSFIP